MQTRNSTSAVYEVEQDGREALDSVMQVGVLNELLRAQLNPAVVTKINKSTEQDSSNETASLLSSVADAVEEVLSPEGLNRTQLHQKLSQLYYQQKAIYDQANIPAQLRKRQYISHCGLIMSPDNCITTQLDDLRVRSFLRGIDLAISDLLNRRQASVHIVYPACGPFAPLLMPLIAYYKSAGKLLSTQLEITLVDVQPGAVQSLQALIDAMGIQDYIYQVNCMDALEYDPGDKKIDLVVLEAMQHGFSREGHFKLARHFATMLEPDGYLIPQQIKLSAALNIAQREYVDQWKGAQTVSEKHMSTQIYSERTILGEIFRVTKESLLNLKEHVLDENTTLIECGKVDIPLSLNSDDEQTLLILTQIQVFADEFIGEYDSGITHPLPDQQVCINFKPRDERPGDLLLESGDAIRFYYRQNGLPGFMATWAQGAINNG
uniref:Methyltransferase domain-containing protein n=1 Tax=Marinomonas sp. (strain MWYL1) TaxID=400668 RepID=A6VVW3_MARMS